MFISLANHNDAKNPKGFKNININFKDIDKIVKKGFAYSSSKFKDDYRRNDNWLGNETILILDIDDNCSIEQAKEIFKEYEFFIITTRSHLKNKNGKICDRFRLILHLDNIINDADFRDEFIKRVMKRYFFVDNSVKDRGRFYFSSPIDAEVFYNQGKQYPVLIVDVPNLQPQQKEKRIINVNYESVYILNELTGLWVNDFGETLESESLDDTEAKLKGARVLLDREFFKGNRNNAMFNCICMLLNDGLSDDIVLDFITTENDARGKIPFNELMACFKSAKRTI